MTLTKKRLRERYTSLRNEGRLHGTIKRALELGLERQEMNLKIAGLEYRKTLRLVKDRLLCTIPFGDKDRGKLSRRARELRGRVKNWTDPVPTKKHEPFHVEKWQDGYYRASYSMRPLFRYTAKLRCCGSVSQGLLIWFYDAEMQKLRSPKGWKFGRDENGLFIERVSNKNKLYRYHFTSNDLESKSSIRTAAIRHERKQKELTVKEKQNQRLESKARRLGIFVCLQDSLKSGNCYAGTVSWARRKGFNTRKWYPLKVIERLASEDLQVQRVVRSAISRAVSQMEAGCCEVECTGGVTPELNGGEA